MQNKGVDSKLVRTYICHMSQMIQRVRVKS